ncbi:hypothetical protein [Roseivivax sp. CAU 1761]
MDSIARIAPAQNAPMTHAGPKAPPPAPNRADFAAALAAAARSGMTMAAPFAAPPRVEAVPLAPAKPGYEAARATMRPGG